MMFPEFDPVALQIGPIAIRWYALAYIVGILLAWRYCIWQAQLPPQRVSRTQFDDLLFWVTIGIIAGGRLGQVLLWEPSVYLANPLEIFKIWKGGMAFHGGLIGVIVAIVLYARSQKLSPFAFSDVIAVSAPIGLFLGRVANFVNGELVGRPTDVPWAFIFPHIDNVPRHPSQLYQAALEGIVLFLFLFWAARQQRIRERLGMMTGLFLIGYAIARSIGEVFREPEVSLGAYSFVTWGQILSVPMFLFGLYLVMRKPRMAEGGK
ncbi:prolipoprotein diacylglyceryl transferase [Dongia deserti]|uniref:prolipoprotein diacylglyceryl transferase n=1 Tax=Dongia deserti TaxID=2268030 RepID=UPI000E65D3DC|nr:prolipoprotein diacylglyceryl transferase [Dongia deserti]